MQPTQPQFQVARIQYLDIMKFENCVIEPGKVTVVSGKNEEGKSSVYEPLKNLFVGGDDAYIKRIGADRGEVCVVLADEDGRPWTVRKIFKDGGRPDFSVKDPQGVDVPKPKQWLDNLLDVLSYNPIEFVKAPPQKKAEVLMQQAPLAVTEQDLVAAGVKQFDRGKLNQHALPALDAVEADLRKTREGIGGRRNQAKASAARIADSLPALNQNIDTELEAARQVLRNIEQALADKKEAIGKQLEGILDDGRRAYRERREGIDKQIAELQAKIAALRTELSAIDKEEEDDVRNTKAQANEAYGRYRDEQRPAMDAARVAIAKLEEQQKAQIQAQALYQERDRNEADWQDMDREWQGLTQQIQAIEQLRVSLLSKLPFKDLVVKDGMIFNGEGVPIDKWNTESVWMLAFRIAKMRKKGCGIVLVDGAEFLDPENFEKFKATALRVPGLQFIVTRVTGDPLKIEPLGPVPRLFEEPPPTPYDGEPKGRRKRS